MPSVEKVSYLSADGTTAVYSYLSIPETDEARPAILILRGVAGSDDGYTEIASRFASWGYVSLVHGWNGQGTNPSDETIRSDLTGAFKFLETVQGTKSDQVAIAGYCKGGIYAFMAAAQFAAVKALVIFHGFAYRSLDAQHFLQPFDLAERVTVPVLLLHGTADQSAPIDTMRELDARLRSLQRISILREYADAPHGFAVSTHPNYHQQTAIKSFAEAREFLSQHLGDLRDSK